MIYVTGKTKKKKVSVLFQAWRLPSWRASLLSTVSIPHSSPSSRISSWALLTRWSRVNQSDLSAAISYDDSDKLPELHGADQLRSAPTLPCLQNCIENRCFFFFLNVQVHLLSSASWWESCVCGWPQSRTSVTSIRL